MIENQLEGCFEHSFEFGAEYDPYCTFFSRTDVDRITLENCHEPGTTIQRGRIMKGI
jgi:hypothetical protein